MTPTEQDKELRKAVWASLASQMTHAINCTDPEHKRQDSCVDFTEKNFEQLMQLITADRKRVALEARIDEINYLDDNFQADSQDWEREHPGYSTAMIPMEDYIRRRAELKAQQEEV